MALLQEKNPQVSVVLPTYNQAKFLPKALDSVFNQTYLDYELIAVNDGSTDDTARILDEYQQHYDFTVIHQENQKLPQALNTGFRQARGQYLTWTSSDNIMLPQMLEVLVSALDSHPKVGLVYADWQVIDEDGAMRGVMRTLDFSRYMLMRINYINACFLYRRVCQDMVGLYDPEYIYAEDWEYWWRISGSFRLMHVPQALYQYRLHGHSLTETSVLTEANRESTGYRKLASEFRHSIWAWYFSKLKWEWFKLRSKLERCPQLSLETC